MIKKSTLRIGVTLVICSLVGPMICQHVRAQDVFIEEGSIIIVEIESAPLNEGWSAANTTTGGSEITYFASKADYFNTPDLYTLTYKIQINNPGSYRFQWHCKVGQGTSPTDFNDSWLRIPDASDFYAKNSSGHIVHPKGVCTDDCPEGSGKDGWFKVYSNGTVEWTWRTRTSDRDPHDIYARFDSTGIYNIQISPRSKDHFLNRFVLYNQTKFSENQATDLSLPESPKFVETHVSNPLPRNVSVYPNPASDFLNIDTHNNDLIRFEIVSLSGQVLVSKKISNLPEKINISFLKDGVYILNCVDKNNHSQKIKFSKRMW